MELRREGSMAGDQGPRKIFSPPGLAGVPMISPQVAGDFSVDVSLERFGSLKMIRTLGLVSPSTHRDEGGNLRFWDCGKTCKDG